MQKCVCEQCDQGSGVGELKPGFGKVQTGRYQAKGEEQAIKRCLRSREFIDEYNCIDADQGQIDNREGISAYCIAKWYHRDCLIWLT